MKKMLMGAELKHVFNLKKIEAFSGEKDGKAENKKWCHGLQYDPNWYELGSTCSHNVTDTFFKIYICSLIFQKCFFIFRFILKTRTGFP